MVVIAGDVPSYYGRHPHQEVQMHADGDQYKLLEPVVNGHGEWTMLRHSRTFSTRHSVWLNPAVQSVLVDVPMDMFSREMDEDLGPHT